MRLVALLFIGILLVLGVSWWVASSFTTQSRLALDEAAEGLSRGPLEHPTASAKEYRDKISCDARIVRQGERLQVACSMSNNGTRDIEQLVVQINLRDREGKRLSWSQGPVIRTIRTERGHVLKTVSVRTVGNSFSTAEAPFGPGKKITFLRAFPSEENAQNEATGADLEILDLKFMGQ
jgi:hypothetical protein